MLQKLKSYALLPGPMPQMPAKGAHILGHPGGRDETEQGGVVWDGAPLRDSHNTVSLGRGSIALPGQRTCARARDRLSMGVTQSTAESRTSTRTPTREKVYL